MKTFEFVNASTLEEAADLLEKRQGAGKAIAGGTDAFGTIKDDVHPTFPELVVNLKTVAGLDYIREDGDTLAIGSLTKIHTLETDPVVREHFPALADAAHAVASPQLRNMGTVAGNICQEPRCWYYRYPDNYFECMRKGGANCNALTGENRFHSIFGSAFVATRPCTGNCPGSVDIPVYMDKLREGDVAAAARILLEKNPLPAVTGRVCPHSCEENCNRGLYDEPVSVRSAERYLGDYILEHSAEVLGAPAVSGAPVAVIGGGPAGLSCAFYLRRAGHPVTVFEKMPEAGGMLRYGIPAYRLSIETMRRQIGALEAMGVEFRLGIEAGRDVAWDEIKDRFASAFLAPGAWGQPKLGLEHEELLTPGLPFLREAKDALRRSTSGRVVVIGGGNVAVDVALTAKRLGADEVTMVCLECEEEMPALTWEVDQARASGVKVLPSFGPARILTFDGRLTGLALIRCACVLDEDGRFNPTYDPEVTSTIEADQVFLAIGQRADLSVIDPSGLLRSGNWIKADEKTQETPLPGVFAGGDVVSGPSTVIAAMAAGRRAAGAIIRHLGGESASGAAAAEATATHRSAGLNSFNSDFLAKTPRAASGHGAASEPAGQALAALDQEETSTSPWEHVEFEANRCFNCGCVAVTPSDLAPVLVALDAKIKTTRRLVDAEQFFEARQAGSTILDAGELVAEIRLPFPAAGVRQAFSKFRIRKAIDFPIVNVAAVVTSEGGRVKEARVAMGAVAPVPVRAKRAEAYLAGRPLSAETAREAAVLAVSECIPLSRNDYKIAVLKTLVSRALSGLSAEPQER
jgi:NADPH-dependent glutamate synthase beta subunit-like oxidoreductase/CO/xanthine dehydrogenase FAD-binding subunit